MMVAVFDALLQADDTRATRARDAVDDLAARLAARRCSNAEKTAASRVDFTMAMRE
jgi:alpha-D-ribose 1-methylphosphonate 5-triphosphate synthase subunit PhnG